VFEAVGRADSDLEDSGVVCRRSIEDIGLKVAFPGLAEEVAERKAANRLVGVVRTVNCALKPLERCMTGMVSWEVMLESVLAGWSVLDRLQWSLVVGSMSGHSRPF
jgi:hypothetical protein